MTTIHDGVEMPPYHIFIPYNAKIADITHADVLHHFLNLETALSETRKIVMVQIKANRMAGTGNFRVYPNEGAQTMNITNNQEMMIVIADGTQRLDYSLSVANDDWDIYGFSYVVEIPR